ncbi:hypothetical protein L596_026642 [Steinernema carpocapsae]|uniref:Uncharacterized protein n=1 Tax=Steinernema carpocapsae TaxID=34508 RepID=A0A4U5M1Z1_STECR|nr:hypothetical protein L596_026642 [Steinernema carpocapsae]
MPKLQDVSLLFPLLKDAASNLHTTLLSTAFGAKNKGIVCGIDMLRHWLVLLLVTVAALALNYAETELNRTLLLHRTYSPCNRNWCLNIFGVSGAGAKC